MARAGFWFGVAGTVIGLISLAPPNVPDVDTVAVVAAMAVSAGLALVASVGYDRLPLWVFHAGIVLASFAATLAIHGWGTQAPYALPYIWITLYAFYFFSLPAALIHTALIGVMFGVELGVSDLDYTPTSEWAITIATITTAGVLIAAIRDKLTGLISNLTDAARVDPLTGLLNRPGFEEAFELELERARRADGNLSVIVGDIDRFGRVNAQVGRGGGDEILHRIGERIRASKRGWDIAARVGGEEFALLAPDTDEHGAYVFAERLRIEVEQLLDPGVAGELTASFGIASFPVHGQTAAALLKAADQALRAAKRLGRNRCVISSAEVPGILARPARHDDGHVELAALLNLAEALDVRDSGNASHSQRVGRYAELIARELGLEPEAVERVRIAGVLHDVGRVAMPDDVLRKSGPLSDREWEWVRAHPQTGARMLETTEFSEIGNWILAHHERPDGRGYPLGLVGRDVPLEASILSVADAYEAMTAERPYRQALDPAAASEELRRGSGSQFDAQVVDALLRAV